MAWTPKYLIQNGAVINWADGRLHPHSMAVTYAATVFEGIRAYRHPQTGGYAVFRLDEHLARIAQGVKIMRFQNPPSGFAKELSVGFSSWTRLSGNSSPPRVKAVANYHAARLVTMQALADGYVISTSIEPAVSPHPPSPRLRSPHRSSGRWLSPVA